MADEPDRLPPRVTWPESSTARSCSRGLGSPLPGRHGDQPRAADDPWPGPRRRLGEEAKISPAANASSAATTAKG